MHTRRSTRFSASGRPRRWLLATCACLLLAAVTAERAPAYLTATGAANAAASVGTLPATTVTATPGAGTVALSWTPVAGPAGFTVSYYVTRAGGTAGGTCPSSAATATTVTTCTDSGLSKGSYSYTVTAIWRSWTSTSAAAPVSVSSGALTHFALSAPSTATAGTQFSLTLTAEDAAGNTVVAYTGAQTLSFSGPSSAPNRTAPAYPASVTFASGVASAPVTLYDVQSTTLTATQGSISGTSGSVAVGAGANYQIAAAAGNSQVAGTAFNVTLTAQDTWGNPTGSLAGTVSVSFSGPANPPTGGTPVYPATLSFSAGTATASVTLKDAQSTTLTVSDTTDGFAGVASGAIVVGPASAASFSLATPATQTAGAAFTETLTALDAYGNIATGYTGAENVTFTGPSPSPGANPPSYPVSVTFASGVATSAVTLYDAQSTTLTATQSTITGISGAFTVGANSAAQLVFTAQPAGATAGFAFTTQPVVTAKDAYGNLATGYANTVTLSIKSGTGTNGAALSGCTSSLAAGVTTFAGCELSLSGTGYELNATDGTLTSTSASFNAASPTTVTKITAGTATLTVPAGVTTFTFTMKGAGGGGGRSGGAGAGGGTVTGTITIPASITSTTFTVVVGGAGGGAASVSGGAAGTAGTGCALGGGGASGTFAGGGGGGGATCLYLYGAPANTIVTVGGGGGGGASSASATGGAGGGGLAVNPGTNTATSGGTASAAAPGGAGGSTLTAGAFPFPITNTGGAGGSGSTSSGGTGGTCATTAPGACGPGGTGGAGATYGAGGGGGGQASGGAGGSGKSGSINYAGGGGGGSGYTGGTQSGSKNYTVTVGSASTGGGGAGGTANANGTAGSVSFTGTGLTLA